MYLGVSAHLVRQSVNPQLQDPTWNMEHITMRELFVSIQNILVGNSSSLYQWEMLSETFVLPPTAEGKKQFIIVDGKDDSLIQRYSPLNHFRAIFSLFSQLHETLPDNRQSTAQARYICEWPTSPVCHY
jgi:hypothetical protein